MNAKLKIMQHTPMIISFSSRKSGGKTLCSTICDMHGYKVLNFADGLKELVCKILDISHLYLESLKNNHDNLFILSNELKLNDNNNDDLIKKIDYNKVVDIINNETKIDKYIIKEVFDKYNPKTIREYLQIIGTELIRNNIPQWHIDKLISKIKPGKRYCIADTRFLNEKNTIEKLGGKCWFIIRPDKNKYNDISNHVSETQLQWIDFGDNILINDSSINNLITHGKNPDNENYYKKTNLFLTINYKNAYLAGYIFLNSDFIKNPFIIENYKLWKCSNKVYPDILVNLSDIDRNYIRKIWLKGIYDYISNVNYRM